MKETKEEKIARLTKELSSNKKQHKEIDIEISKKVYEMTYTEIKREKDKLKPLAKEIEKIKNQLINLGVTIDE